MIIPLKRGLVEEVPNTIPKTGAMKAKVHGPNARPKTSPRRKTARGSAFCAIFLSGESNVGIWKISRRRSPVKMRTAAAQRVRQLPMSPMSIPARDVITPIPAIVTSIPKAQKRDIKKGMFF